MLGKRGEGKYEGGEGEGEGGERGGREREWSGGSWGERRACVQEEEGGHS